MLVRGRKRRVLTGCCRGSDFLLARSGVSGMASLPEAGEEESRVQDRLCARGSFLLVCLALHLAARDQQSVGGVGHRGYFCAESVGAHPCGCRIGL